MRGPGVYADRSSLDLETAVRRQGARRVATTAARQQSLPILAGETKAVRPGDAWMVEDDATVILPDPREFQGQVITLHAADYLASGDIFVGTAGDYTIDGQALDGGVVTYSGTGKRVQYIADHSGWRRV